MAEIKNVRAEIKNVWTRIRQGWKQFVLFWPRLVFLVTFFFASAALTFSVVIWIQFSRNRQSGYVASGQGREIAAAPAPTPELNSSPTIGTAVPPQEEPAETGKENSAPPPAIDSSIRLIIPVAGVKPDQLRDTFTEARSEGRVHNAIDIMAPKGAQVLAALDGKIVRLFNSERGGITLYQINESQHLVLYYAHLDRYADGLTEGRLVKQGEVIAYVGDTGNAGAGNYHLHFALWTITDPKRYWDGLNVNPYPLLRGVD